MIIYALFGVSISRYNQCLQGLETKSYENDLNQQFLNHIVKWLNSVAVAFNRIGNLKTPEYQKQKYRNYVDQRGIVVCYTILFDGCHQEAELNLFMYKKIEQCKKNNYKVHNKLG